MTPDRKAALQWFHDRGVVRHFFPEDCGISMTMIRKMLDEDQLEWRSRVGYSLTDKGRRALHGDDA